MAGPSVIRAARDTDIPQMVEWGREFVHLTPWAVTCPFDADDFAHSLRKLMATGICLVSDKGMAAAAVAPCLFNRDHLIAQDLFVWRDGRLLTALEDRARARGVRVFLMAMQSYEAMRPRAMKRWLRRRGYRPLESYYAKDL